MARNAFLRAEVLRAERCFKRLKASQADDELIVSAWERLLAARAAVEKNEKANLYVAVTRTLE